MSKILVLGAGFVAGPLVKYLTYKEHQITVASQFIEEAQAIANDYPEISISELNVTDADSLGALVAKHDIAISFVPFQFHPNVAEQCIKHSKHMISASYETEEMKALHQQAVDCGIIILNEIGLDPGIDHLSAMQIIDEIHQKGGQIDSFASWCGGLPAPESNDNPLGYKFSWAPRNVLTALLSEATFLKDGEVITVPADELLFNISDDDISDELKLEGYLNRESVNYRNIYGIGEAKNILRGTLRYKGFSAILQACKEMGLLDLNERNDLDGSRDWYSLLDSNVSHFDRFLQKQSTQVIDALTWLGLTDKELLSPKAPTMIDAFCSLLLDKLSYGENEKDMIVLQHEFRSTTAQGVKELRYSTLILEGDDMTGDKKGYSAMSKTVGTPAAIAADLIVSGKIADKGVLLPMKSNLYSPILAELEEQGIVMVESLMIEPITG